ncbi:hypothetical protein [Fundidesulfovibrio terrae]|uniref:hypothetical protein n=1 Tax=Fundidesulfovibrio terrae TaxID=2922866 RepID=UPI001FAEB10E|nr:hypothetical protein [Fundidesulfovibrio terrae]
MNIIQAAQNSIAFNANIAEELNAKACQLDSRLFCFAYYEPTSLPENPDNYTIFYLSVLNIYGLLWDCGAFVKDTIFSQSTYSSLSRHHSTLLKCKKFFSIVQAVRNNICHNNSGRLYFNSVTKSLSNEYISKQSTASGDGKSIIDWTSLCRNFFNECNAFSGELETVMKLASSRSIQRVKEMWLLSIENWYKQDEHLLLHVLAERYILKQRAQGLPINNINESTIRRWIDSSKVGDTTDFYESYRDMCAKRVSNILNSKDCPTPAMPLEFFGHVTRDASHF